jgi:hypothetical protein
LHIPDVPQVEEACAAHSFCGSVLEEMGAQTPFGELPPLSALLHAMHAPVQAVSQQKPSTQLPLVHCEPEVQAPPLVWSGWQVLSETRQ